MARLQELQYTVTGGNKVISGVTLSPRSTRGYLRTSLRCKQESLRIKNAASRKSPSGKLPTNTGEWRRMSLPAMLLGETVAEIKQASQFAREILEVVGSNGRKSASGDPKTPLTLRQNQKPRPENSELRSRRKREKQVMRSESDTPSKQRVKSRINFKVSPVQKRECERENCKYIANRVSPRNRPWVQKTVLFPNPLFHSSPTSQQQEFSKTKSPVIARNRQTPHKFLVKSPLKASNFQVKTKSPHRLSLSPTRATSLSTNKFLMRSPPKTSKFQVKIRSPPQLSLSPTRARSLSKRSPKMSTAAKLRRSFSPSRLANKLASSPSKLRSFSPSRLANRLASPLKRKKSVQKIDGMRMMMSGLKQRPQVSTTSKQFSVQRM